jgi:hypothetical protein
MSGQSFLNSELPLTREIISIVAGSPKTIKPPFYQIKTVIVTICQKNYTLNVQENKFSVTKSVGYTQPCDEKSLPDAQIIHDEIVVYLENHGYDVSSLR